MKIALAQIGPTLGNVEKNLALHLSYIEQARAAGAQLVCFPELSLTGYYLRDLTPVVAVRPSQDDPIFARLLAASHDIDIVLGFVEETERYIYHNSAAYLSGGQVRHVHRKIYLPTYGMFDEQRFLATGDRVRSFETPFGRVALLICEDLWHLSLPYLAWLDGADHIIGLVASPSRGVTADSDRIGASAAWDTLAQALGQFLTCYVMFVNRVGYEDGVSFFGGSVAVGPSGRVLAHALELDPSLCICELDPDRLRRERVRVPLLRDERPEITLRELERIIDKP